MRNLVLIVLVVISMPILIAAQKSTEANVESTAATLRKYQLETQLKNLYSSFLETISEGDIEAYSQMITNKYVFTRDSGETLNKEQRVQQLKAEGEYVESFNITSARFSIYRNSAVGNFDLEEKDVFQGTDYNYLFKVTVFFVKTKNEGWRIAAVHSTRISK